MTGKKLELPYGTGKVEFCLPERVKTRILAPRQTSPLKDPGAQIASLLRGQAVSPAPTGSTLATLCSGVKRALVVVSDRTRVTGVGVYLPVLVDFMLECGLDEDGIEILVATGMHGPAGQNALAEFLPKDVLGRFRVSEHDCHRKEAHCRAGKTTRGTEVYLDKRALDAELVVMTGSIGLHYFAGYRGGRKSILPGIATFESICANHRLTISGARGFHPLCRNGSLDGNPVHEDMVEALGMIPPAFLLNTIVDARGNITGVFTGDPVEAHLGGCRVFRRDAEVVAEEQVDCVIASCGGYPRDLTLIQAHKTMENVSPALKQGGSMVVLAECRHGVGSDTFMNWFDGSSPGEMRRKLASNYVLHGHTALSMTEKVRRFRIYLVSALEDDVVALAGLVPAGNAEEALTDVLSKTSGDVRAFVFPEGSETLPVLGSVGPGK